MSTLRRCVIAMTSGMVMLILSAASAQARLGPGEYGLSGLHWICLTADGRWYGTTFAGWGGRWTETDEQLFIFGNYDGGLGNDSMVFTNRHAGMIRQNPGVWTEWRDADGWQVTLPAAFIYRAVKGKDCLTPPLTSGVRSVANPLEEPGP